MRCQIAIRGLAAHFARSRQVRGAGRAAAPGRLPLGRQMVRLGGPPEDAMTKHSTDMMTNQHSSIVNKIYEK